MWPIIPVLAVFVAQAQPSPTRCFERDQGAQLCEQTEELASPVVVEFSGGPAV